MFTGIVTDVGRVTRVDERNDVRRIAITSAYDAETIDDRRLDRLQRHLPDGGVARGGQRRRLHLRGRGGAGDARRDDGAGLGGRHAASIWSAR